jgi:hypothetical protein
VTGLADLPQQGCLPRAQKLIRMTWLCSHRYWDFGVQQCLDRLMADPLTARSILARSSRSTPDAGSFFSSPEYKLLDADCAGALSNSAILTVLLTLGGDGVQLVNWGSRTATVIGVKFEDLPPDLVQKGLAVKPLMSRKASLSTRHKWTHAYRSSSPS